MSTTAIRKTAIGEPSYRQVVACSPEAASTARRLVATALEMWGIQDLCSDAAQIASELATNAVVHTKCQTFRFSVELQEGGVRISAEDSALDVLPARRAADDSSLGGRGLHLVDALCARWGYELHPQSKTVWAELCVPEAEG
ncbi:MULTISPECIES: ATP-binding protein [Streptomyces]|uniref:ATP-binding protein n=1 Tax=Streptomyces TaxID=1883 RepID=UPI002E2CBAE4|nr:MULTISPECIES: ATP-binding protein [Streptomyces]